MPKQNNTNYISPLSPKEQLSLYRWYTVSVYLAAGLIISLALINGYQYANIRKTKKAYQALHTSLQALQQQTQSLEQLQQEHETIESRIAKVNAINNNQLYNPITQLQKVTEHIPANVCLTEFSCSKNNGITFQGYAQTAESAMAFLAELQQPPDMKHLQLTSLSPVRFHETDKTWYQFHAKTSQTT